MQNGLSARILLLFILGFIWAGPYIAGVDANSGVQVLDTEVDYSFGDSIIFQAAIQSDTPIEQVVVFVQAKGRLDAETIPATISSSGEATAELDLQQYPVRGFSEITYWYRVTLENGEVFTSEKYHFFYEDSRYDWETLETDDFTVHWYDDEVNFGQEMVNIAGSSLQRAQTYLQVTPNETIHIYAYDNAREMQSALQTSGQDWVAGHADPDLGVILVSLPPGPERQLEMERQIPHELMHILMFQKTGSAYERLPVWLNEGLASITELYPNPDYYTILKDAYEEKKLLPITSLCQSFPQDSSRVLIAYAETASFTRYLYNQYGTPGLENLISSYADGLECDRGAEQALGSTLTQLEIQWRREIFNQDPLISAIENLIPWVLVLLLIIGLPLIFSLLVSRKNRSHRSANK